MSAAAANANTPPPPPNVLPAAALLWATHVQQIAVFQRHWLADSSWKTARTSMLAYIMVCLHFGLDPVPSTGITDIVLAGFILFLVQDKKTYSTIKTYLSMGPRVLQLLRLGTWTPVADRPLCAARRVLGDITKPKLAITPDILRRIHNRLDFSDVNNVVLYAAFLVSFWGFLRKSNVVIGRQSDFNSRLVATRADVTFDAEGRAWLTIHNSKIIQFQQRVFIVPLALFKDDDKVLCPSYWLARMYQLLPDAPGTTPLFSGPNPSGKGLKPLTYGRFLDNLKRLLAALGYDNRNYAGQSFRRGGATFALSSGVPSELIKLQGDWHSNAYELYAGVTRDTQLAAVLRMTSALNLS